MPMSPKPHNRHDNGCCDARDGESAPANADSMAEVVASAAIAEAELAAQAALDTQAAVLASARIVADAAAASARAVAVAVDAKAAVVAGAAAAAAEARRIEARLTHDVMHDGLTGLPNKRLLVDRLTQALTRSKRSRTSVAVLFLDLDGFKTINDTLGHAAGDQLLIAVARRLQELLRDVDTCARVGGDEFVIVCEELGPPSDSVLVADRLKTQLAVGVPVGDVNVPVHVSIGIAVSRAGSKPLDLLDDADAAMSRAKATDRARTPSVRPQCHNPHPE